MTDDQQRQYCSLALYSELPMNRIRAMFESNINAIAIYLALTHTARDAWGRPSDSGREWPRRSNKQNDESPDAEQVKRRLRCRFGILSILATFSSRAVTAASPQKTQCYLTLSGNNDKLSKRAHCNSIFTIFIATDHRLISAVYFLTVGRRIIKSSWCCSTLCFNQ